MIVSLIVFLASSFIAVAIVEATTRRMEKLVASAVEGPIGEPIERLRASAAWERAADALLANDIALCSSWCNTPGSPERSR